MITDALTTKELQWVMRQTSDLRLVAVAALSDQTQTSREHTSRDDASFWLAAFADSWDDAVIGKDMNGLVTSWNKAAETMFGYTADEIIGRPANLIIPPDRMGETDAITERVWNGKRIKHIETRRRAKDGTIIPVAAVQLEILHPIRKQSGISQPMGMVDGSRKFVTPFSNVTAPSLVALHVLVVDDVAMNRDFASCFLRAAGHKVTCVESGGEAIAAVRTTDFNVVLMDVRMPQMDGLEATRRIRAFEGTRGLVPIVALTARAFSEQVAECREAGMDSHVPKPFGPEMLLNAVLRAAAAGQTHSKNLIAQSEPVTERATSGVSTIDSELLVFDRTAFGCTASYLTSEAVNAYLRTIAEHGEVLLRRLREPDALTRSGDEICEAAYSIAGSAGMFGFDRLTSLGRRLERAIQFSTADAPALADALSDSLKASLEVIYDPSLAEVEA